MKVEQIYNKNQFIITDSKSGKIVFQSYDSKNKCKALQRLIDSGEIAYKNEA